MKWKYLFFVVFILFIGCSGEEVVEDETISAEEAETVEEITGEVTADVEEKDKEVVPPASEEVSEDIQQIINKMENIEEVEENETVEEVEIESGPQTHVISMKGGQFSVLKLEASVGDTVTFVNDEEGTAHQIFAYYHKDFRSPRLNPTEEWSYTLSEVTEMTVVGVMVPDKMRMDIVVVE